MANRRFDQFLFSFNPMLTYLQGSANIGTAGSGPTSPSLGAAASFAALAGSTITNTNNSVLTGNIGVSPGSSITGFPPGTVSGSTNSANALAAQAQLDLTAAYINLAARSYTSDQSGINLGGLTLGAGVYFFSSSAQLTGTLTLDAAGDPNAVFVFQIGTTLTTAASAVVSLINGAVAGNVFWQVGSSATLGASNTFKGDILALTSITVGAAAAWSGRALARNGAVTLDNDAISIVSSSGPVAGAVTSFTGNGILSVVHVSIGKYQVNLEDQYNRYLGGYVQIESPVSGSSVAATALIPGVVYVIQSVGTTNWYTAGFPVNAVPAVGAAFLATAVSTGSGTAKVSGVSGIASVEVVGNPNATVIGQSPYLILQTLGATSVGSTIMIPQDPADGSVLQLAMMFRNSSLKGKGE